MKTVSLLQPYATLLAIGALNGGKGNETRSKGCPFKNYRGKVYIHASKAFTKFQRQLCETEPFKTALAKNGYTSPDQLPLGAVIGSCNITGRYTINKQNIPPSPEKDFGDYTLGEGRMFFTTTDNKVFPAPIPARGQLGLWNWEPPEGFKDE